MRSKKLDTEHLARQVEDIINDEGISPERLAQLSGIAKSTIYAIINRDRPTTQREVAKKIARATGREFTIDGDKIHYQLPEDPDVPQDLPKTDIDIVRRFSTALKPFSIDDKATLRAMNLEDSFARFLEILLSTHQHSLTVKAGKNYLADNDLPLHGHQDLAQLEKQFCKIWDRSSVSKKAKIKQSAELLKKTNLPKLIYTSAILEIDINLAGDAHIKRTFHALNVGEKEILGDFKLVYFEENQRNDIELRGLSNQKKPLQIEIKRDYENYKEFFCRFGEPLKLGDSIIYSYEHFPKAMFKQHHYWDWTCRNLTLNSKIVIRHEKGKKFKKCIIKNEFEEAFTIEKNPNLKIKSDDQKVEIVWIKYYPQMNHKYRLLWEFDE